MDLIERARGWSDTNQHPDDAQRLFNELAGEIERLWAFEKDVRTVTIPWWQDVTRDLTARVAQVEADSAAEIERLKGLTDTVALNAAWGQGYLMACKSFSAVTDNLIAVASEVSSP